MEENIAKTLSFQFKVTPYQRNLIRDASFRLGLNPTAFLRMAVLEYAQNILNSSQGENARVD